MMWFGITMTLVEKTYQTTLLRQRFLALFFIILVPKTKCNTKTLGNEVNPTPLHSGFRRCFTPGLTGCCTKMYRPLQRKTSKNILNKGRGDLQHICANSVDELIADGGPQTGRTFAPRDVPAHCTQTTNNPPIHE